MKIDEHLWRDKKVFLTGHTGFKGAWMTHMLSELGATVTGYSLQPDTIPSLYNVGAVSELATSYLGDILNYEGLRDAVAKCEPDVVFHMAAQPLVRRGYLQPRKTVGTNVCGTVNLLEAVRECKCPPNAVVIITSDKCYKNNDWDWGYRENDDLGGTDMYSGSKACAELITSAYAASFFQNTQTFVATARAGNVVGGGDWAADRLLPDLARAVDTQSAVGIRSPRAVRPWQHVLECNTGYLLLAQALLSEGVAYEGAWNFGSDHEAARTVEWIVEYVIKQWPGHPGWVLDEQATFGEQRLLRVDPSKARSRLGWRCRMSITETLDETITWYRAYEGGHHMPKVTRDQVKNYYQLCRG